ncbi:hypothetical protein [Mesorhizobium sp.]|uniref:Eco57I restriction-modification methylase domain-containing protein n=1 Tax=Mesorhizobium sp. TaxID=1871066 RepID=UPI0025FEBF95|nr:hypothetical protein [Mesorhizobium sp.]
MIWPILRALGWDQFLTQQNLTASGRQDVPDAVLFVDDAAKSRANAYPEEWRRYEFGAALVESKRWLRPLDRRSEKRDEVTAPSTQMLRYLRRVDDLTNGSLRWGILTNGLRWRLYYSGAQSIAEDFFEIDLGSVLSLPGFDSDLFPLTTAQQDHWFKVFVLAFRREAFIVGADQRSFHDRALAEGKFYEERVAKDLSDLVFGFVFPTLTKGIAEAAPTSDLQEVRDAALILLYRLLFILYAEDRDLLPVREARYDDYSLREKVRLDVKRRKDAGDVFSATAARYWTTLDDLCRAIDAGDASIGLPPYNGGLFNRDRTPLLAGIRLGDAMIANVIDVLSFIQTDGQRHYINYRDLSVQQLGSIYERLLEHEVVRHDGEVQVRPNIFARKGSGSYYTPDDLVGLILEEALRPLVSRHTDAFRAQADELGSQSAGSNRRGSLTRLDPALKLLELKVCDPAMGSGHFLVSLVDKLADHVIEAMAEAEAVVDWGDYHSPLADRIEAIRNVILDNAERGGWTVNEDQLDDRHIIRRMVLKRCVYGVDKNPMAVELAKVALWLHTFTVGAPLSFLDHHLRAGDSLFGSWIKAGIEKATAYGSPLVLHEPIRAALQSASQMQIVEGLTDAEIAEAHRSQDIFDQIREMTAPLNALLSFIHALDWIDMRGKERKRLIQNFFDGQFGDPVGVLLGKEEPKSGRDTDAFQTLLREARTLIAEERFLHWQVAFPGVWSNWEQDGLSGGFDAIVGNPPWDRMKLQQVEWFAARRRDIALAPRAADRARMIRALADAGDPLFADYAKASGRAETAARLARTSGDYPLLSGGDTNINSLFVERAKHLSKTDGMVGLLVPSGIATETNSQPFFSALMERDSAKCVYDFFNKKRDGTLFFPDVYYRFKFCVLVFSAGRPTFNGCKFASFVRDVSELTQDGVVFGMTLAHFEHVNPNSRTAPIYRAGRDKVISTRIYDHFPILINRSGEEQERTWPVRYLRMFDMANDSGLFRTRSELEGKEGAYPIGYNRFRSSSGDWVPLYEGKMVQAYDHRASSVVTVAKNVHRSGQGLEATLEDHQDAHFQPEPRYYVRETAPLSVELAIKDVTSTTNARSILTCMIPPYGAGHTLPLLQVPIVDPNERAKIQSLLCANLNSIPLDFIARTKILSNHASWYIVEQLPVIPSETYDRTRFGPKSAREIVTDAVLELTYTAHDMAPFATAIGHVNADGSVTQPFLWDDNRRMHLKAKLDAVYFHLYGITDRDDVRYIYSTFPIVEKEDIDAWNQYRSRELCLHYMNALGAGHPDAIIQG